ncbi:MAG: hypothetical protein ACPGO3_02750, partial [Magnetospiraceae bacterium]
LGSRLAPVDWEQGQGYHSEGAPIKLQDLHFDQQAVFDSGAPGVQTLCIQARASNRHPVVLISGQLAKKSQELDYFPKANSENLAPNFQNQKPDSGF